MTPENDPQDAFKVDMSRVGLCETCGAEENLYTYSLPGVPITVGNCIRCFTQDLYPYWVLVGNTASMGGLAHSADWWREAVERTLPVVGKSYNVFLADVEKAIASFAEAYEPGLD